MIEDWLNENGSSIDHLADKAGVSARAITKTLRRERPFQNIFFADKVLVAIERHICELKVLNRPASANTRGKEKPRLRSKS